MKNFHQFIDFVDFLPFFSLNNFFDILHNVAISPNCPSYDQNCENQFSKTFSFIFSLLQYPQLCWTLSTVCDEIYRLPDGFQSLRRCPTNGTYSFLVYHVYLLFVCSGNWRKFRWMLCCGSSRSLIRIRELSLLRNLMFNCWSSC